METNQTHSEAAVAQERIVLPFWAEYGEGPPKRGDYNLKVRSKDGREKTMTAWHNPGNGHWLADGKECGYVDIITPPGETEEWRIIFWQIVEVHTSAAGGAASTQVEGCSHPEKLNSERVADCGATPCSAFSLLWEGVRAAAWNGLDDSRQLKATPWMAPPPQRLPSTKDVPGG